METILPAFISTNERREPASIKVNEQSITQFPFDKIIENPTDLKVEKKGNSAVYYTAYQQFQNANPKKVEKDFVVSTSLL